MSKGYGYQEIRISVRGYQDIRRREKVIARLLDDVYPQLRTQPYFGRNIKKLKGYRPETWRYRIGGFRLFYEIDDDRRIVFMIAADTRQRSY